MPTIHLIHGFSGFGKTSFAKELASKLPAVRLTNDEFMVRLYGRRPSPESVYIDCYNKIDSLIWDLAEQIIKTGVDVIFDYGFWTYENRKIAFEKAKKLTDNVVFHNITCDMNVAKQRTLARTESDMDQLLINEEIFETLLMQYEPLSTDEGYPTINH
jgi:predicted kinase